MNVYYNDRLVKSGLNDIHEIHMFIADYLDKKNIKSDDYWRWVGLDNDMTMVDFGSWRDFFYIDCPSETLLQNDKKRDL